MPNLETMQKQLVELQKKIAEEKKRQKAKEAKDRMRMIEIVGAFYLDRALKGGSLPQLVSELDQKGLLKKTADRKLFGLDEPKSANG